MPILRHIFVVNIAGKGNTVLVGNPLDGFEKGPLGKASELVPESFLQTQDRIDQALSTGKLAWSMNLRCDGKQTTSVGYGCALAGRDDKGRMGLSFLHSIELPAQVPLYCCVRGLLQMLTPRGAVWLTGLIEDAAVGAVGEENAIVEIAKAAESSIVSCPIRSGVVCEYTSITGVEHDCAGAGPVAWSLLSLTHHGDDIPWEAYDTATSDGRVFTLVKSASPTQEGRVVQASQFFEVGLSSLASPISMVEQGSSLIHIQSSLTAEDLSLETNTNLRSLATKTESSEMQKPHDPVSPSSPPTDTRDQPGLMRRGRSLLMFTSISAIYLIFGLIIGIQIGKGNIANMRSLLEKAKSAPTARARIPGPSNPKKPAVSTVRAGETRLNPKDGLVYVWLPASEFQMGCTSDDAPCDDDELPVHKVRFSRGYWIGQTEVTFEAYRRFVSVLGLPLPEAPPQDKEWKQTTTPIVNVNWKDASTFCQHSGGRLPTEAEWEFAARGAAKRDNIPKLTDRAWISSNSGNVAHPVGQKIATGYGFFDVLGNVWEWCEDWFDPQYYAKSGSVAPDPHGPISGVKRILRGGSYKALPKNVRISNRHSDDPEKRSLTYGFRCMVPSIK